MRTRTLTWLLLGVAACHPYAAPMVYPSAGGLSIGEEHELQEALQRADLVFIGELLVVDSGWSYYAGAIAPSSKTVSLRVVRLLKGNYSKAEIAVAHFMLSGGPWIEQDPKKGIRLSPRFFQKGQRYVVLASYLDKDFPPGFYDVANQPYGCWLATRDNIRAICSSLHPAGGEPSAGCHRR